MFQLVLNSRLGLKGLKGNHTQGIKHFNGREEPVIWKGHDTVIPPTMSFFSGNDEADSVFRFHC